MVLSPEELFSLPDDEKMFQEILRKQLASEKRFQEIIAKSEKARDFDRDLFWEAFQYFREIGFTAYGLPDEYGGTAMSSRASVILTDELALSSQYQFDELEHFKETMFFGKVFKWAGAYC